MADKFSSFTPGLTAPASSADAVMPSDSTDLAQSSRALYIGTGGDLALETVDGDSITLRNAASGMLYPIRVRKVRATGTTAADIVALR